jgi:hypothetical protein
VLDRFPTIFADRADLDAARHAWTVIDDAYRRSGA